MTSTTDGMDHHVIAKARLDSLRPEQRQRLQDLARRAAASPNLQGRFEAWAARQPEAIAVSFGDRSTTYGALNARADVLARTMIAMGVTKGSLVAITLDRGIDLIVAILAVLKAGGAYLPIDPSVPEDRQHFIRKDACARVTITESKYRTQLDSYDGAILLMDALEDATTGDTDAALPSAAGEDLAYVIYTSGSSGEPKGVMVEHRNVMRLFLAAERHFAFKRTDVWMLFHSYAFDFSVWEIWGALLYGGRLVVVPHTVSRSPAELAELVLAERVTVLNQTPTAFSNLMTELLAMNDVGALRYIVFGGEALEPKRLGRWFERYGDDMPELVNMYGITETTVHVTYKRLRKQDAIDGISDIGDPLEHLNLYVLNERRRPVLEGVIGELYVGGAGIARGYLNRPALTAERFIDSPFSTGERLYKTGDLARRLDSGALEYIGRNDDQVKLRGFRMELGDIERKLIDHSTVRDAVVAVKGEGNDRFLAAYLVLANDAGEEWKQDLHRHLTTVLPEYMVPSYAVALDALPVTNNGKIDRSGLPEPAATDVWQRPYVGPSTPVETRLCALIADLLKLDMVGIHDNFFALGGDSLKTVNLVAHGRAAGMAISVADIFDSPLIVDLARTVSERGSAGVDAAPGLVGPFDLIGEDDRTRLPTGIEAAYPMSRLQQGMVYHNLASADNSHYHNVINQRYRGGLDIERMRRTIANLIDSHEILRTSFHMEGYSEPMQLVHQKVTVPMHVIDLSALSAQEQDNHIAAEIARLRANRLDLMVPPLFQAHIYRVSNTDFELIWLEHHAILDGWSLASFMTQLSAEYFALERGATVAKAPPSRYREFIAAEKLAIADPEQVAFWSDYVAEAPYTQLQCNRHDGGARQIHPVEIPPDYFARCRNLASALGVPLKSLFLAAYAKVVGEFSGDLDLLVGLTTHGRPEIEGGDDLLGLYVSTHPLRLDCRRASWRELIQRCFRAEAEIWARRHYPFSEIKRLQGDRELFETTFTYNHFSVTEGAHDIGIAATRDKRAFEFDDTGLGVAFVVIDMKDNRGQLHVAYDSHRIDDHFALRIRECLILALERMTDDVNGIADVLGSLDQQCIASLSGSMPTVMPEDSLLREFETHARNRASSPAVEQNGIMLSYAELDAKATRLGSLLLQEGIAYGSLVGFDVVPSLEMTIALLALFKIGAVFVPLDPEQSASRLQDIVEESGLAHIIADTKRRTVTMSTSIKMHWLADIIARSADLTPAIAASDSPKAASIAYVIYTSGSTGKPKGVVIEHGNAVSFLRAIQRRYAIVPGERLLQISNIGFDIFIEEILFSIFSGGCLILRSVPRLPDAQEFWALIDRYDINLLSLPTAYWNLLCAELPDAGDSVGLSLRLCTVGGEAMQRAHAERWLARWGERIALINSYGPTETTATATTFDIRELLHRPQDHAGVPIGRPLDNCPVWVLGKDMSSVPQGVIGELHIGGEAVSPGYLNNPEQTALKFIDADAVPGILSRLYCTGDLVRVLDDGQIEYCGRVDGQVKIRGFRVELDEVRQVITSYPGVKQCVVIPVRTDGAEVQLAAYVVLDPASGPNGLVAVRESVKARLPGYMRPAAWMHLDELPMTPNRKIDIAALPAIDIDVGDHIVAPSHEMEWRVQALWESVLGREVSSVEADFFAIGGHSLLLTRLLMRIGQSFDVDLSMAELMRARTIREMSTLIASAGSFPDTIEGVPAQLEDELEW